MANNPSLLTRRTAIKNAVALVGGTLTATQFGLLSDSLAAITDDSPPRFLNPQQFEMLSTIADLVIPETDTPGAIGAGVPRFIDMMLADWASPERRARYVTGLDHIDQRARDTWTNDFANGSTEQQFALLRELDKESFAEDSDKPFFAELKKMLLFAYYSSEVGATVELRFQRIPVDYLPCVPMADDHYGWFWSHYNYGL